MAELEHLDILGLDPQTTVNTARIEYSLVGESLDGCGESVTDGFGSVVGPTLLIVEGSPSAVRPRSAAKHSEML